MSLAQFKMILEKLPAPNNIHLQGQGEPLLNADLPVMVRVARLRGATIGTTTNASLLTMDLSARMLDAGVNRVNLSLDTVEPELFSETRPGIPLETILANIFGLSHLRTTEGYDASLAIAFVATQSTISSLPGVVGLASDMGLDEVYVQNLNSGFLPQSVKKKEAYSATVAALFTKYLHAAEDKARSKGIKLLLPSFATPQTGYQCAWPFNGCNITWDGYVAPCCLQPDPDILCFGNIFETDFASIWESRAYWKFRDKTRDGIAEICRTCPDLTGQMWHPEASPFLAITNSTTAQIESPPSTTRF